MAMRQFSFDGVPTQPKIRVSRPKRKRLRSSEKQAFVQSYKPFEVNGASTGFVSATQHYYYWSTTKAQEGLRVSFTEVCGPKGPRVIEVRVL